MSKPAMLYLIGVPGSGKTTTLRIALQDAQIDATYSQPFLHTLRTWVLGDIHDEQAPTWQLFELGGRRDGGFGGTDALPMNVQPKALAWLESTQPSHVVAEGDRLANAKFFEAILAMGYDLAIAYLGLPEDVAERRRNDRARSLGMKAQNPSWVRGRETKVHNLFCEYERFLTLYDAMAAPEQVARELRRHPFFANLPPFFGF